MSLLLQQNRRFWPAQLVGVAFILATFIFFAPGVTPIYGQQCNNDGKWDQGEKLGCKDFYCSIDMGDPWCIPTPEWCRPHPQRNQPICNLPQEAYDVYRGLEQLDCQPIELGQQLKDTQDHLDEFLSELVALKQISESFLVLGRKQVTLANDCRKANCGAQCSGNKTAVTKYNICEWVPTGSECEEGGENCECVGTTVQVTRSITCREPKTVPVTVSLSSVGVGSPPCESEWVCGGLTELKECGWESCKTPIYTPANIDVNGGTQQLICGEVEICEADQSKGGADTCLGQGEGLPGEAPCRRGITAAYNTLAAKAPDFEPLLKKLQELDGELNNLMSHNKNLAQDFADWYSEGNGFAILLDCFAAKDAQISTSPIEECPYDGNTYYVCK